MKQANFEFFQRYGFNNELIEQIYHIHDLNDILENYLMLDIYYELMIEYRHDNPGILELYENLYPERSFHPKLSLPIDPLYKYPTELPELLPPIDLPINENYKKYIEENDEIDKNDKNKEEDEIDEKTNELVYELSVMNYIYEKLPLEEQRKWFHDNNLLNEFLNMMKQPILDPYNQEFPVKLPKEIINRYTFLQNKSNLSIEYEFLEFFYYELNPQQHIQWLSNNNEIHIKLLNLINENDLYESIQNNLPLNIPENTLNRYKLLKKVSTQKKLK